MACLEVTQKQGCRLWRQLSVYGDLKQCQKSRWVLHESHCEECTFSARRALRALARASVSSAPASWLSLRTCCRSSRVWGMSVPIIQRRQRSLPRCRYLQQPSVSSLPDLAVNQIWFDSHRLTTFVRMSTMKPCILQWPKVHANLADPQKAPAIQCILEVSPDRTPVEICVDLEHNILTRPCLSCQSPSASAAAQAGPSTLSPPLTEQPDQLPPPA